MALPWTANLVFALSDAVREFELGGGGAVRDVGEPVLRVI